MASQVRHVYQKTYGSGYDNLNHPLQECRKQQRSSARHLREISANVRNEQKMLNKKKVWFSSAGLVAALLDIGGFIAVPISGTLSAGLTVVGKLIGRASGIGDIYMAYNAVNIDAEARDKVREILDQLGQETTKLTKVLEAKLESHGFSKYEIIKFGYKGLSTLKDVWSLIGSINTARDVARASTEAEKIAVVLAAQESSMVMSLIEIMEFDKKIHGTIFTCFMHIASVGWKLKDIIERMWKISSDASEVADTIDEIASVLEKN